MSVATVVVAMGLSGVFAGPSLADTGTWVVGGDGVSVSVPDIVIEGNAIHLEGTGWTDGTDNSDADGSWIGVKLGASGGVESNILTTEPASGQFVFPGSQTGTAAVWSGIIADDNGDFSADIPFPTPDNTNPALPTAWAPGTTHHLQLLTGSTKPDGDTPRSVYVTFTVSGENLTVTASSGGRGAPAGQVTITVSSGEGRFAVGETLTAKVDGVERAWAKGGGVTETGAIEPSSSLVFAPGELRAGIHSVEITGTQSGSVTMSVTVLPTAAFSGLTQGSAGTATLGNLPAGASVSSVALDGTDVVFSGLPVTADEAGAATVDYEIPADQALGSFPVVVTLSDGLSFTLSNQKISPDATVFGEEDFTVTSSTEELFQGLYQSAYSATENALFIAAAAGNGDTADGYIYKVDPETLKIITSVHVKDVTDDHGVSGQPPFGIGVDDVNGTVWVTNTRATSVAVYSEADLSLLQQFPSDLIGHPRDVIYDPVSDRVFASSASEGTNGDGYISVFDAKTFEKIDDVQTGPRVDFNPVSLALFDGTLVSPSLSSNKVAKIDTQTLAVSFLEIEGINIGGRGASGIAFDDAGERLYIASQNSDEVVVADATTGATIKEVPTGAGALNVAFDKENQLVYVTNFGGTTVTVLDADGNKVANLPIARANHASVDGQGNAFVVDKNADGNKLWKISYAKDTPEPDEDATPVPTADGNVFFADDWAQSIARTAMKLVGAEQVLVGDFNNDGVDTFAVRHGNTYTLLATNRSDSATVSVTVGDADALAVVGDFDGNGFDDLAVRDKESNRFEIHYNSNGVIADQAGDSVMFGRVDDVPLVGDWNGDGVDSLGVQRGATYFLDNALNGGSAENAFVYGRVGDRALVGDFDGDGQDTVAIERGNTVFVRNSLSGGVAEASIHFGRAGDALVVGDWFGTGTDQLAAYRH